MPPHPFPVILPSRTGRASKRGEVLSRSHRTVGAELGQGMWKRGQLAAADSGYIKAALRNVWLGAPPSGEIC